MKKILLPLALLVLCLATALAEEGPAPLEMDLTAAIQEALAVNPEVLVAQAGVDAAKADVLAALAKNLPGCTVTGAYDETPRTVLGGEVQRSTAATFTISQTSPGFLPRIIGYKTVGAVEQALWDQADAEAELAQTRINVAAKTIEKYLAALEAEKVAELNAGALKLAREDERIAKAKLEAGTTTKLDALKAESNREQAELDLRESEENKRLAFDALLLQIGRPLGRDLTLVPVTVTESTGTADVAELTALALKTRPEILSGRTAVRKAENHLAECKNEALPRLELYGAEHRGDYTLSVTLNLTTGDLEWSAGGSYQKTDPVLSEAGSDRDDGLSFGVKLIWTPFDGGARRAAVAAAEAALKSRQAALAKTESQIGLEIRQKASALKLAALRLAQAKRERDLTLQARELALIRYREGVGLFSDLGEASQSLAAAEIAVVRAENDFYLAQVYLDQACGGRPAGEK